MESFRKSPIAASSIDLISIRLLPYSDLVSSASTSKVILIVVDRVLQPLRCAYKRARQKWWWNLGKAYQALPLLVKTPYLSL